MQSTKHKRLDPFRRTAYNKHSLSETASLKFFDVQFLYLDEPHPKFTRLPRQKHRLLPKLPSVVPEDPELFQPEQFPFFDESNPSESNIQFSSDLPYHNQHPTDVSSIVCNYNRVPEQARQNSLHINRQSLTIHTTIHTDPNKSIIQKETNACTTLHEEVESLAQHFRNSRKKQHDSSLLSCLDKPMHALTQLTSRKYNDSLDTNSEYGRNKGLRNLGYKASSSHNLQSIVNISNSVDDPKNQSMIVKTQGTAEAKRIEESNMLRLRFKAKIKELKNQNLRMHKELVQIYRQQQASQTNNLRAVKKVNRVELYDFKKHTVPKENAEAIGRYYQKMHKSENMSPEYRKALLENQSKILGTSMAKSMEEFMIDNDYRVPILLKQIRELRQTKQTK